MLDDAAIARYARQIVVPGIGAAGQEKLLQSTVLVVGHPRGCATAGLYLRAAGVQVVERLQGSRADAVVVAEVAALEPAQREELLRLGVPVCWYDVDADGYRSGVHPGAPIPASLSAARSRHLSALHDAAACDVASLVCGLLVGLLAHGETSTFRSTPN